jgi:hypothetical protein
MPPGLLHFYKSGLTRNDRWRVRRGVVFTRWAHQRFYHTILHISAGASANMISDSKLSHGDANFCTSVEKLEVLDKQRA